MCLENENRLALIARQTRMHYRNPRVTVNRRPRRDGRSNGRSGVARAKHG